MAKATILIADDDKSIRTVLAQALGRQGYSVRSTGYAATLWQWVTAGEGDLVISDVAMPDGNGLELLPRIRKLRPALNVIIMSAQKTVVTAIKTKEGGAFEYLPKPFDIPVLLENVERALAPRRRNGADLSGSGVSDELPIVGHSTAMQDIFKAIARLTDNDLNVLLSGELGTGKELVARVLHDFGRRRHSPFVSISFASMAPATVMRELFGAEQSALGATQGRLSAASGGTLFLDEVSDIPLDVQARLAQAIQDKSFRTIDGGQEQPFDLRIVGATHKDLKGLVEKGEFREDLYYRLNVVPLRIPPLRERTEDIPLLVRHFALNFVGGANEPLNLTRDGMEALKSHVWPGNVRELENLIQRLCALYSPDDQITADVIKNELTDRATFTTFSGGRITSLEEAVDSYLEGMFRRQKNELPDPGLYNRLLHELERPLLSHILRATRGNQIKAAAVLGLNRNTLRKKLRDLEIEVVRGYS